MKQVYLGAAALLLGTSALALAKSPDPVSPDKGAKAAAIGAKVFDLAKPKIEVAKPAAEAAKPLAWSKESVKIEPAAASWWSDDTASSKAPEQEMKVEPALAGWTANDEAVVLAKKGEGNPDLDLAVKPDEVQPDQVGTGVGGPLEEVDTAAVSLAALTPRPATHNYPPCSPGPGDDNCIQLYERGVRQQLASWTGPTGGLGSSDEVQTASADTVTDTGVGGPYEPVDTSMDTAMAGDGSVDGALGEVASDETLTASADAANAGAYTGMGGPLEEVAPVKASSDYPPCRPGPGDDHCIQLYERGVSG
ncbi:MAG TPA: hypothetical protein VEW04_00105 [Allosphingosinicella sp.]|nr:hypothetical protein [Allosphingosinicella sp.]